ncbi:methyltransferase domain-containing protein [Aurantimonas sp. Leaf443]|uniref:class I SAM-dependent methyltransferase n=1 Tax=Aurantimonas sp. Leaf443 TaxID=1736378 RepID=UPI000A567EC3|nr:methyltransferase domain-containing protein [Aurantimonas sp. Leaf443]
MTEPRAPRTVLNIGSGPARPEKLHAAFRGPDWREVRLDIDPEVLPDILGTMTDMGASVATGSVDAIWSSHNIEHLPAHEVPTAFAEFARVLTPGGFALLTCPDIEAVAALVVEKGLDCVAYVSPAGPVTPLDMLFGHGASIAAGHGFMAHRTGFTVQRLARIVLEAGFGEVRLARGRFDLWALCLMPGCALESVAPFFADTAQRDLVAPSAMPEADAAAPLPALARSA